MPHRIGRCAAAIALAILVTACFRARPLRVPAPVVDGDRLQIDALERGAPPLVLEGAWTLRGDRHCVDGGTVRLLTASGAIPFDDAHLCVTVSPVSIEGEATVAFPALGFLAAAGLDAEGRRARIRFATGAQLGELDLDGHRLRTHPRHYYLHLAYQEGFTASFGNASLATPGGAIEMVIAPQEPLVYVAGRLSLPGLELDGAFGFSPAGRLRARPNRLPGAEEVSGHILAAASLPLPGLPVAVSGEILLDLDADDDGITLLDGDGADLALVASGAVSIGYDRGGTGLSIQVGDGALTYDASTGLLEVAGETGGVFDGTPLAPLAPGRGSLSGHFRSADDFALEITVEGAVLGYATQQVRIALDHTGIRAALRLTLPADLGGVDLHGELNAAGFTLSGTADLTVAGLRLLAAEVSLGTAGVSVRGKLELPALGTIAVAGAIGADGAVGLEGTGELRPFGLHLANAHVAVSSTGATIAGQVTFLGSRFAMRGTAGGGHVSLTGSVKLVLLLFQGEAVLTIADTGARAMVSGRACIGLACIDLAGFDVDTAGNVCPIFPIIGKQCVKLL
jgi:hypothetical protein